MNNSKLNNVFDESTKDNFVVMYENYNLSNEMKEQIHQTENQTDRINAKEIVEYTDDVADQVRALHEKITINLEEYFLGKNDINDVNNKLRQCYKSIKNYCRTIGLFIENNEAYKCKILKDIYRNYRYNAVIVAVNVNDIEGRKHALEFADDDTKSEEYYIYYNSDYYFECEELREILTDMVIKLAIEEKIITFDTRSIDKRKRYVYDYGFNYAWSWSNKMNIESGVRINKNLVPPEDIKVFYKEYIDANKDGKLVINYQGNNVEVDVHAKYRLKEENSNLFQVLLSQNIQLVDNIKLKDFLNSFYISTKDED